MTTPLLATKLHIPAPQTRSVLRPRLTQRLDENPGRKLILISAPAGFGKTTLVSEWLAGGGRQAAWLSLDAGDNDPARFLGYLVAALQAIAPDIGKELLGLLQSPQPPPAEAVLTTLLNEIAEIPDDFTLVLDDYHLIDAPAVDDALGFLVRHLPPQMRLVIATREDLSLPLARLRARGQLTELRAADLRFTPAEAAEFLTHVMGLDLSAENIAALEARTEGWIAGLQLAAISMQGRTDVAGFISSFTGSHRFVIDYLVEEVLRQQSDDTQAFLLRTSILERMCGPLCDALAPLPSADGQDTLESLERANLFIVPLDDERRWYRYHHLFGELLRKQLGQSLSPGEIAEMHLRASQWLEDNGLLFEAFQHATTANDVARAGRLIESPHMGLHLHSVAMAVLAWLSSLPAAVLDAHPELWVRSATVALMGGQTAGVEERLQAAEKVLRDDGQDAQVRDLIGQIACARATLALTRYEPEVMLAQARRALEYLHPDDVPFLFTAHWAVASASLLQGDRATADRACRECITLSQKSGSIFSTILATTDFGELQELDNQLVQAEETYRSLLPLFGEHPQPSASRAYLGLATIYYEWNDLDAAERFGQQSLEFSRKYDRVIDRFIVSEVFLARMKLARGDIDGAATQLSQVEQSARQRNFLLRMPEIAAAQVLVLLRQGQTDAAAQLVKTFDLPFSRARVLLAQGDTTEALAVLASCREQAEAKGWADERLKALILQALALQTHGNNDGALQVLSDALEAANPGGFIRLFVDEGPPMAHLLAGAAARQISPEYVDRLLMAFQTEGQHSADRSPQLLIDPLSQREMEILDLIAQGLSNQQIGERLFLALDTVKGHNRRIFDKLQVQRRTEAIARARELGLL